MKLKKKKKNKERVFLCKANNNNNRVVWDMSRFEKDLSIYLSFGKHIYQFLNMIQEKQLLIY